MLGDVGIYSNKPGHLYPVKGILPAACLYYSTEISLGKNAENADGTKPKVAVKAASIIRRTPLFEKQRKSTSNGRQPRENNKRSAISRLDSIDDPENPVDVEAIYGTRLETLGIYQENFGLSCKFLDKCQITCSQLDMKKTNWTKEQCQAIIQLVKPVKILLASLDSDRFEALFQSETIKIAKLILKPEDVKVATKNLLPRVSELDIQVRGRPALSLFGEILQMLFSSQLPHFRLFHLAAPVPQYSTWNIENHLKALGDYKLTFVAGDYDSVEFSMELPPHLSSGSSCNIVYIYRLACVHITYTAGNFLS